MSNRFYAFLSRLVPNTVAKSGDVNSIVDGLVVGFDALQGELNRALKLPASDSATEHNFTAVTASRASKLMQFDASGNPIASNILGSNIDMASKTISNLPFASLGSHPITLDQLNAFAGSLAGLPSLTGQSGKYLSTEGTTVYWATIPAIPAQSAGTANLFLMSDGGSALWSAVPNTVPAATDFGVSLSHDGASFAFRRELDNLVLNPSGAVNYGGAAMGWTGIMPPALGARGWRFESATLGGATTGNQECVSFTFSGSTAIAVAADVDSTLLTGGTLNLVVDFRDGADASISTISQLVTAAVSRRYRVTGTSPASCAKVRVRLEFAAATSTGAIGMSRVKAERGASATPFNDAATLAWIAGHRALTELGRGFAAPIVRVGDATSTGAKVQMRSAAGAQDHDFEVAVTGGTSGTAGRGNVALAARSISNTGPIGYSAEFDNGNSGAAKTIDFSVGSRQRITMSAACSITLSNFPVVGNYRLKVIQNGTGNFLPTFSGVPINWAGTTAPEAQVANAVLFVDLYYDGSTAWGSWTPWS